MTVIRSLRPNVSREEALRHFEGGALNFLANALRGRIQSIAEFYIPFRLFQVSITNAGNTQSSIFALDARKGTLDIYQFEVPPKDLLDVTSRNVLPPLLSEPDARSRLLAKVRRLIFSRGFFKLRDVQLEAVALPREVWVPYWVCFRGRNGRVSLSILDAVRRRPEGAKARHLLEDWLRSS